jgi:hypothetical protein
VSLAIETSASTPSRHNSLHTKEAAMQIKILALYLMRQTFVTGQTLVIDGGGFLV